MRVRRLGHLQLGGLVALAITACVAMAIAGCRKPDGLTAVSGRVTWRGEPVPRGDVYIEPDASQGNKGPQCRSSIIDGAFVSRPQFGAIQGPVVVTVVGTHTPPDSEFSVPLFPRHEFKTEIPKGTFTLDIVVPDDIAATPQRR
jgi:hypothetical protein